MDAAQAELDKGTNSSGSQNFGGIATITTVQADLLTGHLGTLVAAANQQINLQQSMVAHLSNIDFNTAIESRAAYTTFAGV